MRAPCIDCPSSCGWCFVQYCPLTMGCAQYVLRKKALDNNMTQYQCFQGYFTICCCIKGGSCNEESCPDFCLCLEGCCCNCCAISVTRIYIMDRYNLSSDPCDYRLIRINNCLQISACICSILSIFIGEIRECTRLLNLIADCFYFTVTGCMTSQVRVRIASTKNCTMSLSWNAASLWSCDL